MAVSDLLSRSWSRAVATGGSVRRLTRYRVQLTGNRSGELTLASVDARGPLDRAPSGRGHLVQLWAQAMVDVLDPDVDRLLQRAATPRPF